MPLKHVNAGFFFTVIFFSVGHNLKHGKQQSVQEPMFSEIKRNISLVNHLLQDLLQKYALLKQIAKAQNEKTDHKVDTNADEFFKGDSKIRVRAKVRLAKPRKPVETTLFQTDKSLEKSEFEMNKNEKLRAKDTYDDNLSPDSLDLQEVTSVTKLFKDLATQNQHLERNVKKKVSVKNDFSSENTVKDNTKEKAGPTNVEKLLVIHLGDSKEGNVKKNRASSLMQDFIPATNQKMETTKSILFKSETKGHHDSEIEEELEMQREILKVKQLRAAVGNACSQVVLSKCLKALRSVLKDVCKSDRKCSDDFNNDFTNNGIAACNKEFKQSIKNRGRHVDYVYHKYPENDDYGNTHQQQSQELTGAQFIDYTRVGDLDMTCLQALSKVKEPKVNRTSVKNDTKTQAVNLLRDKYEKACRQASYEKCRTACNSTADKTCKQHDCINDKIKALKYSCKRRCRESNSFDGGDSSSGSSSSQTSQSQTSQSQSGSSDTS